MRLPWGYDAPDYTVGPVGNLIVKLQTGNVIQDGAKLYLYTGANISGFSLTDQVITGDTTDFKAIGGVGGKAPGDLVRLRPDYATPNYIVGAAGQGTLALQNGNVIQDGATLYRYVGTPDTFNLTDDQDITNNPNLFIKIGGQGGATYRYIGPAGAQVDLASTDYTNTAVWNLVTQKGAAAGVQTSAPARAATSDLITPTYTALGGGAKPIYNNPQDLAKGNTVFLDARYDTPTYSVGPNSRSVTLRTGNVIQDGPTLYRYVGTAPAANFALTDDFFIKTAVGTLFEVIGGMSGRAYTYIGSGASQVDLANTDYTNAANWKLVPNDFTALAQGADPFSNTQTVSFGDQVQVDAGYNTPKYKVGAVGEGIVNLQTGDVIEDGSTLYRYDGKNTNNFSLTDANITNNPTSFVKVGISSDADVKNKNIIIGKIGGHRVYKYLIGDPPLDLANTDYGNLAAWKLVTTDAAPAGVKIVPGGSSTGGAGNEGPATNNSTPGRHPRTPRRLAASWCSTTSARRRTPMCSTPPSTPPRRRLWRSTTRPSRRPTTPR